MIFRSLTAPRCQNWNWSTVALEEQRQGPQKQIRLPVTPDILRQICKHWYSSWHDYETIMLWSVSTLCFFGFFRLGELLSPTNMKYDASFHLSFEDVAVDSHWSPSLVKIHLKTSKTDQERKGADVYVGKTGDILCPVSALLAYLPVRGALPGPLFQLQDRTPLTKDYFIQKFRAALTSIGLKASQYAGHSFRIGAATTGAERGHRRFINQSYGKVEEPGLPNLHKDSPRHTC